MNCKFCGAPVEQGPGGHRQREYCNDAHRQAYWRAQHQADQSAALLAELEQLRAHVRDQVQGQTFTGMLSELVELRAKVADQASEIAQLRTRLDVERRYLEDSTPRYFRAWLRKQPSSPWRDRFLSDQTISPRGSRAYYEAHIRRLQCSEEEHEDFVRLWKLMLLQS